MFGFLRGCGRPKLRFLRFCSKRIPELLSSPLISLFIQYSTPACGMIPPTFSVDLPNSTQSRNPPQILKRGLSPRWLISCQVDSVNYHTNILDIILRVFFPFPFVASGILHYSFLRQGYSSRWRRCWCMQSPGLAWMLLEDRKQMDKQKMQPNLEGPGSEIKNVTFGQPSYT